MNTRVGRLLALTACVTGLPAMALAGDLDPPAGAISPTLKDLVEVEPRIIINADNTPGDADSVFRITAPGSYYLVGDVTGVAGSYGIEIAASHVSIDLRGYRLVGVSGSLDGIKTTVASENLEVCNGVVTGWGADGIDLTPPGTGVGIVVRAVRASGNGNSGVRVADGSRVMDCVAHDNGAHGIVCGDAGVVTSCAARANGGGGIAVNNGCVVTACSAIENDSFGIIGFDSCTITDCTSRLNGLYGITVQNESTVAGCTSTQNIGSAIAVTARCTVRNNTCNSSGGGLFEASGVYAAADENRIEGNHCVANQKGVHVAGEHNVIIRNTCAASAVVNYDIAINNRFGAIIDHTTTGTPGVFGNGSTGFMGTTDPWANFAQ